MHHSLNISTGDFPNHFEALGIERLPVPSTCLFACEELARLADAFSFPFFEGFASSFSSASILRRLFELDEVLEPCPVLFLGFIVPPEFPDSEETTAPPGPVLPRRPIEVNNSGFSSKGRRAHESLYQANWRLIDRSECVIRVILLYRCIYTFTNKEMRMRPFRHNCFPPGIILSTEFLSESIMSPMSFHATCFKSKNSTPSL